MGCSTDRVAPHSDAWLYSHCRTCQRSRIYSGLSVFLAALVRPGPSVCPLLRRTAVCLERRERERDGERALTLALFRASMKGVDRELRKSGDATYFATDRLDGPAPLAAKTYVCGTPRTVRCAAFFVRSEKSNALVGGGVPRFRRARRTSTAPSFGGMQLFATEAWRAAPLLLMLLTRSAQLAQPTVRPVTAMGSPSLALSHLCCGLCERHCSATAGTL